MKKEILLPIEEKSSKWWIGSDKHKITWYTKRGEDIYLIPGSEFPEKKLDPKTKEVKKINSNSASNTAELKLMLFIALGSFIGVILAALLISVIL
jgi:hypothetical protein